MAARKGINMLKYDGRLIECCFYPETSFDSDKFFSLPIVVNRVDQYSKKADLVIN